ncbi:MAG: hypothetical protein Hyperionvirus12_21 [Hyperionvirus sp.]|uniref:Sel1 repeat family protein n=1 Tax=Hyperionvirus sp. TaxID=2487770 RepID=A0A3G5AB44_9VIRU|nr:MAG: hypothetical protein Hyperionvirus12_21 [Hyperionvirus sp.]
MDSIIKSFLTGENENTVEDVAKDFSEEQKLELFKGMEFYAKGGDCNAQYWLSEMYEDGIGVPPDDKQAFFWGKLCAEKSSDHYCHTFVGRCYEEGKGTEKDEDEAIEWYQKATLNGSTRAFIYMARIHERNDDHEEAIDCYMRAHHQYEKRKDRKVCKESVIELATKYQVDLIDEWIEMHRRVMILQKENENLNNLLRDIDLSKKIDL